MKRLCKALLCLLIISLVVTVGAFSALIYHHSMITRSTNIFQSRPLLFDFEPDERAYPYAEALKNDEFKPYSVFDHLPGMALAGSELPTEWLTAPITVHYYSDPKSTVPVFTVEKGDTIYCSFPAAITGDRANRYRGLESLPYFKQGWRLAKPFIVEDEEPNDTLLYVKTDDLTAVFRLWLEESPVYSPSNFIEKLWYTYSYPKLFILFVDQFLYFDSIFLSPDLVAFVYPPAPFISFGVSVILLAAYLALRRKTKIQNKTV